MLRDLPWKTGDSSEQIVVQEHFTSISKDVDQAKANEFLSIHVPEHKTKKLYASLVLWTLEIQLHNLLVDKVRLASTDFETLSIFVKLSKKNKVYLKGTSRKQ